jgi:hypothetical protein
MTKASWITSPPDSFLIEVLHILHQLHMHQNLKVCRLVTQRQGAIKALTYRRDIKVQAKFLHWQLSPC